MLGKYGDILKAVLELCPKGLPSYLVGGTVRDLVLGIDIDDIDVALFSDPLSLAEEVGRLTGGRVIRIGESFGTIRVVSEDVSFDFTQIRGESIGDDLALRDFTINAMAYPLSDFMGKGFFPGGIIDPLGGYGDLKAGVLRSISEENLLSDPVRLFRIFRFSSTLGFAIDKETEDSVRKLAPNVVQVKGERVRDELFKGFQGPWFLKVVDNSTFYSLLVCYLGALAGQEELSKRVKIVSESLSLSPFGEFREILARESSGGRRYRDLVTLLLISWNETNDGENMAKNLCESLRLSRREKSFLIKITKAYDEKLTPGKKESPLNPEAVLTAGRYFPHLLLFAIGMGFFEEKQRVVNKCLKYYSKRRKFVEGDFRDFPGREMVSLYHLRGGKKTKEVVRTLQLKAISGDIKNRGDASTLILAHLEGEGIE